MASASSQHKTTLATFKTVAGFSRCALEIVKRRLFVDENVREISVGMQVIDWVFIGQIVIIAL